ncbi:endonuclease/exonuclease/phosphatase family protein [Phycicoccus flavus]|uniref:endonuclease/exonuclease/phosphatase family protein n=1 Tax=Phycicoccus flavus TaxID=2502783 RepID=UPI0026B0FC51
MLVAGAAAAGAVAASAPAASAVDTQRVRVVTANVNFALDGATVRQRFENYSQRADIVLVQEAKNVNFHTLLGDRWIVRQDVSDGRGSAKAGSAVIVRRSIVPSRSAVGPVQLRLGTTAGDCRTQARYIAHVTVRLNNGGVIRPASAHLPPGSCQTGGGSAYDEMITSLKNMSDLYPGRLVIGGDWNKVVRSDPNDLSRRTGGRIVPRALPEDIDGFYKPARLAQDGSVREVGFASKGHDAVQMVLLVPSTY